MDRRKFFKGFLGFVGGIGLLKFLPEKSEDQGLLKPEGFLNFHKDYKPEIMESYEFLRQSDWDLLNSPIKEIYGIRVKQGYRNGVKTNCIAHPFLEQVTFYGSGT